MPRLSSLVLSTERAVETVRPPNGHRAEFRIKGIRNLVLRVAPAPSGSKSWVYRYPSPVTGRWRRISLGTFPMVGLENAKTQAITILAAVKAGQDPLVTQPTSSTTFGELVEEYLAEHKQRFAAAWTREVERVFKADILPSLKLLRVEAVTKADVVRVVERVAARGAFNAADCVLGLIRAVYNWAAATGRTEHDPTRGLRKRKVGQARERVLTHAEIRTVWHALDSLPVAYRVLSPGVRDAFKLQLLVGVRIGEAVGAAKSEVNLAERIWTIPAARTKSRREHKLPLPDMALKVLAAAMERSPGSPWLLPSYVDEKPLRPKSASRALLRLRKRLGVANIGTHDLRRSMATGLGDLGVSDDLVERILNHAGGMTRRHYNHAKRMREMREALDLWASKVADIIGAAAIPEPPSRSGDCP